MFNVPFQPVPIHNSNSSFIITSFIRIHSNHHLKDYYFFNRNCIGFCILLCSFYFIHSVFFLFLPTTQSIQCCIYSSLSHIRSPRLTALNCPALNEWFIWLNCKFLRFQTSGYCSLFAAPCLTIIFRSFVSVGFFTLHSSFFFYYYCMLNVELFLRNSERSEWLVSRHL